MKVTIDEVVGRVSEIEADNYPWRKRAEYWEQMWRLEIFERSMQEALQRDGQEQVTLATPLNVVRMAESMITSRPDIDCPARDQTGEENAAAVKKQRWLKALWQRTSKQARYDLVAAAYWQSLVFGIGCFDIRYVADILPKRLRGHRLPIHIRTLHPFNVGVVNGELYTEIAYHKYGIRRDLAKRRYPKIKLDERRGGFGYRGDHADIVEVIDYFYVSEKDGSIWNTVICDKQFVKPPMETDYYDIPIVPFYGDDQPSSNSADKSYSILRPLEDIWPYQCRLASQIGTGLLNDFNPHIALQNEYGAEMPDDHKVRSGETVQYPWGTKIEAISTSPNYQMAAQQMALIQKQIDDASFPQSLFGDAPANTAGYAQSASGELARSRVKKFRTNLETAMELVNEIALCIVEHMADEPVMMWAEDPRASGTYSETIGPDDINGYYDNKVTIYPQTLTDQIQKATLGIRANQGRIVSRQTVRERFMPDILPDNEELRVLTELAMDDPQLQPALIRKVMEKQYGPGWMVKLGITAQDLMAQPGEGTNGSRPPEGMPPGMMPPGMMPPGMPPGMMPPGANPMMGGPQPLPVQPEAIMGGMIPPQMEGQLTEDVLNLPPEAYQALVDAGLTTEEELSRMLASRGR